MNLELSFGPHGAGSGKQNAKTDVTTAIVSGPRKRFPLAALAALALILTFEIAFIWHYRYRFWDANYILLEKKQELLTGNQQPDDIAILGSSRFYHVRPKEIAVFLGNGANVSNYSWGYCGLEAYEAMLRGLIQAGRAPKVILADGFPEIFGFRQDMLTVTQSPGYLVGFAQTAPFVAACRTMIGQKEWSATWDVLEHSLTPPSTLYRASIRQGVEVLFATGKLPPEAPQAAVENWINYGFQYAADTVAAPEQFHALETATGPYILQENDSIAESYERFVRLANEHDIRVILMPVPNNALVYEKFSAMGIYHKYDMWLSTLEKKYKNFQAPGPRWFTWPGLLYDATHVNAAGADRHMNLIKDILRDALTIGTAAPRGQAAK